MKEFGLVALLALIVSISFTKAAYIDEYPESYSWAFKNGITTQPTIEKANMYGSITRIELSKMISNYAINVLNKKVDTSKKCQFSDISDKLNSDYDFGATKACQLGLMGQGISKFRPNDSVTRAEFGTILSRLLYGTKYDGGKPYYIRHINNLNIGGIMNNTKNAEKVNESRGNVMVMLKRSETLGDYKIPTLEELNDNVFQCLFCEPDSCDEYGTVCISGDCYYEGLGKKNFLISYKNGYIGYNWRDNMGDTRLNITYRKLDNPCKITYSTDLFHYNYDNIQTNGCVIDYGYPSKKVETFNSKEKDPRKCMDDIEKYFYKLIIGQEQHEYFNKIMNKFKESIN